MLLSEEQLRFLLEQLSYKTVVERTGEFPFRIQKREGGYSDDPIVGQTQATLSMMLEAKTKTR